MAISPRHQIRLPGGQVLQVDPSFSSILAGPGPYSWPEVPAKGGGVFNLEKIPPPTSRQREFVYVTEMPEGWCSLTHLDSSTEFRFSFPQDVFPYVWLFMALGGWRDSYTVVLEPCTNLPKDLTLAYNRGSCASLAPGAMLDCEVIASVEETR